LLHFIIRRLPIGLLAALTPLVACAGSAHAGLLVSSATNCSSGSLSQPFLPWLDSSQYALVPGGGFEPAQTAWSLNGGAAITAGNESYDVGGSSDSSSLSLPDGSSATSPATCVGLQDPTIRLFARNAGAATSALQVSVSFRTSLGLTLSTPIETITGGSSWNPTAIAPILANVLTVFPGQETNVAFSFTPVGPGGDWHIDDVYVDPWMRGG
jgi:hypothetical protein